MRVTAFTLLKTVLEVREDFDGVNMVNYCTVYCIVLYTICSNNVHTMQVREVGLSFSAFDLSDFF